MTCACVGGRLAKQSLRAEIPAIGFSEEGIIGRVAMGKRWTTAVTVGVLALMALLVPSGATAAPTLTLSPACDEPQPASGVHAQLSGMAPFADFVGTIKGVADDGTDFGTIGPQPVNANANGDFEVWAYQFGASAVTWTVTVETESFTLEKTLRVDCSPPPPTPSSKADCKRGGWRQYGFRNQGQCVSSVVHASKRRHSRRR